MQQTLDVRIGDIEQYGIDDDALGLDLCAQRGGHSVGIAAVAGAGANALGYQI